MLLLITGAIQLKCPEGICPQAADPMAVPECPAVDAVDGGWRFDAVLHVVGIGLPEVGGHWKGSQRPLIQQLNMSWITFGLQQSQHI